MGQKNIGDIWVFLLGCSKITIKMSIENIWENEHKCIVQYLKQTILLKMRKWNS